jgi:hypothetical protein
LTAQPNLQLPAQIWPNLAKFASKANLPGQFFLTLLHANRSCVIQSMLSQSYHSGGFGNVSSTRMNKSAYL